MLSLLMGKLFLGELTRESSMARSRQSRYLHRPPNITSCRLAFQKLQLSYGGDSHVLVDSELQVFLGTGTAEIWLPANVADSIYALQGTTFNDSVGYPPGPVFLEG